MLNPDTAARIKACRNVYTLRDTARHFGVSPSTVHRVWNGQAHTDVPEAPEPDNVISKRVPPYVIKEDGRMLLRQGMSLEEAAATLGVSRNTLRNHLEGTASPLMVF